MINSKWCPNFVLSWYLLQTCEM